MKTDKGWDNEEEQKILDALWERREDGLALFCEYCEDRLFAIARRILPWEDARECVNDTLLAVWNSIPPAKPEHLLAYATVICRNKAFNRLQSERAAKRNGALECLSLEMEECLVPASADKAGAAPGTDEELGRLLSDFLRALPKQKRRLFVRRYWYGDSVTELGEMFGYSESKVKSILFRTRKQLRKYLEKEGVWV